MPTNKFQCIELYARDYHLSASFYESCGDRGLPRYCRPDLAGLLVWLGGVNSCEKAIASSVGVKLGDSIYPARPEATGDREELFGALGLETIPARTGEPRAIQVDHLTLDRAVVVDVEGLVDVHLLHSTHGRSLAHGLTFGAS